jgi:hypothetical protein
MIIQVPITSKEGVSFDTPSCFIILSRPEIALSKYFAGFLKGITFKEVLLHSLCRINF